MKCGQEFHWDIVPHLFIFRRGSLMAVQYQDEVLNPTGRVYAIAL